MPLIFAIILVVSAIARFIPHPANFAPVIAIGVFCGLYAKKDWQAYSLPLFARFISDLLIGFFSFPIMISVYLSTAIGATLGILARRKKNVYTIGGATILGAVVFYLLTNFAVWYYTPYYSKTLAGLVQSYTLALPFFRNSLLGDIFYVSVFVGCFKLSLLVQSKLKNQKIIIIRRKNATSRIT